MVNSRIITEVVTLFRLTKTFTGMEDLMNISHETFPFLCLNNRHRRIQGGRRQRPPDPPPPPPPPPPPQRDPILSCLRRRSATPNGKSWIRH